MIFLKLFLKLNFHFSFFHKTMIIKITFGKIFYKLILLHHSVTLAVFIKFLRLLTNFLIRKYF